MHFRATDCIWTEMKSLTHEILSFYKSLSNICLIKGQKATSTCNNSAPVHQKKSALLLWLEGATIHWVASVFNFNIMNVCHELAASSV